MRGALMLLFSLSILLQVAGAQDGRRRTPGDAPLPHPPVAADGSGCASCHAPIVSHRVMHGPAGSGACQACHMAVDKGGVRVMALVRGARKGDTRALCATCHEEIGARMKNAHVHAPAAGGDCTSCHDPHGSASRFQLPASGNASCLTCHEDVAGAVGAPFRHGPAVASCTLCHDAHAGKFPFQLRARGNDVCLACHAPAGEAIRPGDPLVLFGNANVSAHAALITAGPRIALDPSGRSGHPTLRHPVEGPTDLARPGKGLSCTSCHNPHGASGPRLLRFAATGTSALCVQCHRY